MLEDTRSPRIKKLKAITDDIAQFLPNKILQLGLGACIIIAKTGELLDKTFSYLKIPRKSYHIKYVDGLYPDLTKKVIDYTHFDLGIIGHISLAPIVPIVIASYLTAFALGGAWALCTYILSIFIAAPIVSTIDYFWEDEDSYEPPPQPQTAHEEIAASPLYSRQSMVPVKKAESPLPTIHKPAKEGSSYHQRAPNGWKHLTLSSTRQSSKKAESHLPTIHKPAKESSSYHQRAPNGWKHLTLSSTGQSSKKERQPDAPQKEQKPSYEDRFVNSRRPQ